MKPIDNLTYNCMAEMDWDDINHFDQEEFEHPDWLDRTLICTLDDLREYVGKPFIVHCDFEFRNNESWHSYGMAIDGHFEGIHPYDQYEAACRFDDFNGVGFYTWWQQPGIHVDTRPKAKIQHDARWCSVVRGRYQPVTAYNLRGII